MYACWQVIFGIIVAWILCAILTATNAIPNDKNHWSYHARTDVKMNVLHEANWFRFPYPCKCTAASLNKQISKIIIVIYTNDSPLPPVPITSAYSFSEHLSYVVRLFIQRVPSSKKWKEKGVAQSQRTGENRNEGEGKELRTWSGWDSREGRGVVEWQEIVWKAML